MMTFEDFKRSNQGFGYYGQPTEKEMLECYEIAQEVERTYQDYYGHIDGPRIGDIVEFADHYRVYKHAKITEDLYGCGKYGLLTVCESGSSHTDGRYFSTSGGAFKRIHKDKMQLVGEDENLVWTWGCYGSGAHQGIYFTLKVRRWLVPYDAATLDRSKLIIRGRGKKGYDGRELDAVAITNFGSLGFYEEHFESIKAFRAWADYVGYKSHKWGSSMFEKASHQRIEDKCYTDPAWQPPVGAKPIKHVFNGEVEDCWVVTTDESIMYYWPNIYDPDKRRAAYGSPEYERSIREFHKYSGNPMGV